MTESMMRVPCCDCGKICMIHTELNISLSDITVRCPMCEEKDDLQLQIKELQQRITELELNQIIIPEIPELRRNCQYKGKVRPHPIVFDTEKCKPCSFYEICQELLKLF